LASDDNEVVSYDSATGQVSLKDPLKYYHFGAPESTADEYNGLDIRGEVILLSRNIKISGEDIESWGAQFVTSDTTEFDVINDQVITRFGQTFIDNVEFYNCSQIDTHKAAIRFENAQGKWSSVTNSAFHHGYGWGANVKTSANIHFANNNFFFFGPIGVSIGSSNNITFDGNVVAHIQKRTTIEAGDMFQDKEGGFVTCTYFSTTEVCRNIQVTNNIVAGAHWTGFTAYGHECGDYTANTFKGNVAHSINGSKGGTGAIIIPDRSSSTQMTGCFEGSHFSAYKCSQEGAMSLVNGPHTAIFSHMTIVDNYKGLSNGLARSRGPAEYGGRWHMQINKNFIVGEAPESLDQPTDGSWNLVHKDKCGIYSMSVIHGAKPIHPTMASPKPYDKYRSYAAWGGKATLQGNIFKNFHGTTVEG